MPVNHGENIARRTQIPIGSGFPPSILVYA
jgi:hypothetical protein